MADPKSNAAMLNELPEPPALPVGAPRAGVIGVRHRHAARFTVVGNHLAQHPDLSAVAIGLGVHILSLPDRPDPLITCDGCERAFRSRDPTARCADCRGADPPGTERAA